MIEVIRVAIRLFGSSVGWAGEESLAPGQDVGERVFSGSAEQGVACELDPG